MSRQTQNSMLLVGVLSGGIGFVAFLMLLVVGGYTFSPALFLALLVALGVAVFLFVAFHPKDRGPALADAQRSGVTSSAGVASSEPMAQDFEPAPTATAEADAADQTRPAAMSAPRESGADDLKKIKGVGPKLEQMLHGMGFYHYDQIAQWTPAEVAWVDDNLEGFKGRVSRDSWVDQAKTLAAGGETEFSRRAEKGDTD